MGGRRLKYKSKTSLGVSKKGIDFIKRFCTNRRKIETDESDLAYWKLFEVIVNYFKINNDRYLELLKLEYKNDRLV